MFLQIKVIEAVISLKDTDHCVIDVSCSNLAISCGNMKRIFCCKSYLQVKWISDPCLADGIHLLPRVFSEIYSIYQYSSRNDEIVQKDHVRKYGWYGIHS